MVPEGVKTYKRTATIDAVQWDGTNHVEIAKWAAEFGWVFSWMADNKLKILTLEGPIFASVGDFIAKGISDEFWPIKPDIMDKTYEETKK